MRRVWFVEGFGGGVGGGLRFFFLSYDYLEVGDEETILRVCYVFCSSKDKRPFPFFSSLSSYWLLGMVGYSTGGGGLSSEGISSHLDHGIS
jgi:hypothetical protein